MRFIVALCCLAVAVQGQATCTAYCSNVLTNCVGTNAVYDTTVADVTAACMTECAAFPQTTATDLDNTTTSSGNTLGCREYHAGAAAAAPTVHCPHASPASTLCNTGTGKGACDDFCNNLMKTCPTTLLGGNWAACSAACSMYADMATFTSKYPVAATMGTGDLGCRRYHVTAARTDATAMATHCPHADLLGAGVCGMSPAASFCQADAFCPAADTGFDSVATCMNIWMNIPAGGMMDVAGDTQYCRAYHLSVALQGGAMKTTHCPHTGQQGNGFCGNACDAYCSQYMANCTGVTGAAAYSSMATCKTACGMFNNNTMINTGDTLGCRLYHVGVAQQSKANSMTHCPHASQSGGGTCGSAMTTKAPTAAGSPAATAVVSGFAVAAAVAAFFL